MCINIRQYVVNKYILSFVLLLQVSEMENDMSPVQEDEGPNAVSQLAKKVCRMIFGIFYVQN